MKKTALISAIMLSGTQLCFGIFIILTYKIRTGKAKRGESCKFSMNVRRGISAFFAGFDL